MYALSFGFVTILIALRWCISTCTITHQIYVYVDFIDLYVAVLVIYVDFSDHYTFMSFCPNKNHHNKEKSLWSHLWRILTRFKKKSLVPKRLHFLIFNWVLAPLIWECKWGFQITNCLSFSVNKLYFSRTNVPVPPFCGCRSTTCHPLVRC